MKIGLVSDTHLTPKAPAFGVNWAVVAAWIDTAAPDVVVHLGDSFRRGRAIGSSPVLPPGPSGS